MTIEDLLKEIQSILDKYKLGEKTAGETLHEIYDLLCIEEDEDNGKNTIG